MVYVGTFGDNDPHVLAFDAAGAEQCSGVPATCEPLWTAPTGDPILSMLATANGIVYAASEFGRVLAFDAGGTINCSGSPTSCTPLWSGQFSGRADFTALAIANGVLYIGAETGPDAPSGDDHGAVLAFDANGVTGCSGTPTNCNPLVELPTDRYINGGSPAVVNGRVYVGDTGGKLYAYALPSA
jgi:outer membrane protein assembly factor BamB